MSTKKRANKAAPKGAKSGGKKKPSGDATTLKYGPNKEDILFEVKIPAATLLRLLSIDNKHSLQRLAEAEEMRNRVKNLEAENLSLASENGTLYNQLELAKEQVTHLKQKDMNRQIVRDETGLLTMRLQKMEKDKKSIFDELAVTEKISATCKKENNRLKQENVTFHAMRIELRNSKLNLLKTVTAKKTLEGDKMMLQLTLRDLNAKFQEIDAQRKKYQLASLQQDLFELSKQKENVICQLEKEKKCIAKMCADKEKNKDTNNKKTSKCCS